MQIQRKITVAGINNVRNGFDAPEERTFVARIVGVVSSYKIGESQYGPFTKFMGEFRATNQDGEISMSPVCMLPPPVDEMLMQAVDSAEASGVGQVNIKLAFDFYIVPADTKQGYKYEAVSLLEVKHSDPLLEIVESLGPLKLSNKPAESAKLETAKDTKEKAKPKSAPAKDPA